MADNAFNDLNESLMDEVLGDMADNFFGRRKGIDDMRDLLDRYADSCREKAESAIRRAACFNALLPDPAGGAVERFYERIGVRGAEPLINAGAEIDTLPDRMPFALTRSGPVHRPGGMGLRPDGPSLPGLSPRAPGGRVRSGERGNRRVLHPGRADG